MDIFLLNKKDIDSKTILHQNLCNMHIALHNMHIAQVSILQPTYVLYNHGFVAQICRCTQKVNIFYVFEQINLSAAQVLATVVMKSLDYSNH